MMLGAMAIVVAGVGVAIGFGLVGDLARIPRFSLAVFVLFLAFFGFYHGMRDRKNLQLDISGIGQVRLKQVSAIASCTDTIRPHVGRIEEIFRLMPESTLWPYLLLLRLKAESGRTVTVPVLPDSLSPDKFRALSVACRWIAMHNNPAGREEI
jgi:hypothetical protein